MSRCHGCTPVAKLIHVGVGQLHGLKKSATGARADRLEKHDREVIGETEQAKPYLMGNIVVCTQGECFRRLKFRVELP
ncbi:hypothetical protein M0657_003640 [Pyricularia oryzae]|uniref:Uncharacterized protein n=1 Tax=Pyricularia oryzae TaxID=318829 RepID=A0A4P7NL62_PYROR|nr:hypothetical protein M0657_003640 [Pyricularia oryzae]KAI7929359.1 hypothetical protein M9X92_001247 [Pyricularia oryzae]QBZ62864.1 hypothetical protein PoMZ_11751 [Pyricularia oryzae]